MRSRMAGCLVVSTHAVPQYCPYPRELDDLELLGSGALTPLTGFNETGSPGHPSLCPTR